MAIKAVIFDLDDTLIRTQPLYLDAIHEFASEMASHGIDYYDAVTTLGKVEREAISDAGMASWRFPVSMVKAATELASKAEENLGVSLNRTRMSRRSFRIGQSVFGKMAPLIDGAVEVIGLARELGLKVAILTRGDPGVQNIRIESAGLADKVDHAHIVDLKSNEAFQELLDVMRVSKDQVVMVGNSLPSDIIPALSFGIYAIYIPHGTFNFETEPIRIPNHDRLFEADSLADVSVLLKNLASDEG